jgi:hypothetical protein
MAEIFPSIHKRTIVEIRCNLGRLLNEALTALGLTLINKIIIHCV